jgi:hypothetical protein
MHTGRSDGRAASAAVSDPGKEEVVHWGTLANPKLFCHAKKKGTTAALYAIHENSLKTPEKNTKLLRPNNLFYTRGDDLRFDIARVAAACIYVPARPPCPEYPRYQAQQAL